MGHFADSLGTLGILGGGQLARMTALAARSLGYRVNALDPVPSCPVAPLVDELFVAPHDDLEAAHRLAAVSDVVTLDLEHVPAPLLEALATVVPVRPSAQVMYPIQDRGRQKRWLDTHGFPVGPYRLAEGEAELRAAIDALGGRVYVKSTAGGFDGRGQRVASDAAEASQVLLDLGTPRVTVERALALKSELSVLVARNPSGDIAAYPPALNHHEGGILAWSLLPAPLSPELVERAQQLALAMAKELCLEGLCAVEMFLLEDDSLLVNELAPRPHNSYHGSERACETSQFEQHVRAVFDLPLGPVGVVRPTAMANLLGDVWLANAPPRFDRAWRVPSVRAQLYGKADARPGRKLGHLTATGTSPEEALERVLRAKAELVDQADASQQAR